MPLHAQEFEITEHAASTITTLGEVLKQELGQAKQDLIREAKQQLRIGVMLGTAGVFGFAALLMVLEMGIALWTFIFPFWASCLVMAGFAASIAIAAALIGFNQIRKLTPRSLESDFGEELEVVRAIEKGIEMAKHDQATSH